jgi:predicted nuclease of predicted toxin-antitoxin system
VKLLFDQNLSPRLVRALAGLYPGSVHVRDVGLHDATDEAVWIYAAGHDLTITSKDADFRQRSFLLGHPPKVVYVNRGNCTTSEIESLLREHHNDLRAFEEDANAAFLALE